MNYLRLLPVLTLVACATSPERPEPPPAASSFSTTSLGRTLKAAIAAEDWVQALPLAKRSVSEHPEDALAWRGLGIVYSSLGENPKAISAYEKSLSLEDNARARNNLGTALAREGKVAQALPHFERAVALAPEYGLAWLMLAQAQSALGRWDEATVSLAHAQRLLPEAQTKGASRVIAQEKARASSRLPGEALVHHARGGEFSAQGRDAQAEQEYEAALRIAPGSPTATTTWAGWHGGAETWLGPSASIASRSTATVRRKRSCARMR